MPPRWQASPAPDVVVRISLVGDEETVVEPTASVAVTLTRTNFPSDSPFGIYVDPVA